MLDEGNYKHLADAAFARIERGLDGQDPDVVDVDRAGDVVTITLVDRIKCIVNTQRPTRQIWLAARDRAWHFAWDAASETWRDEKDPSRELFATITSVVREHAGVDVSFAG